MFRVEFGLELSLGFIIKLSLNFFLARSRFLSLVKSTLKLLFVLECLRCQSNIRVFHWARPKGRPGTRERKRNRFSLPYHYVIRKEGLRELRQQGHATAALCVEGEVGRIIEAECHAAIACKVVGATMKDARSPASWPLWVINV